MCELTHTSYQLCNSELTTTQEHDSALYDSSSAIYKEVATPSDSFMQPRASICSVARSGNSGSKPPRHNKTTAREGYIKGRAIAFPEMMQG